MRAKRTDLNHQVLTLALRRFGWDVIDTHALPNFVDAVACRRREVRLIEFKGGVGKLTKSQAALINANWPIFVIRTVEDCEALR